MLLKFVAPCPFRTSQPDGKADWGAEVEAVLLSVYRETNLFQEPAVSDEAAMRPVLRREKDGVYLELLALLCHDGHRNVMKRAGDLSHPCAEGDFAKPLCL